MRVVVGRVGRAHGIRGEVAVEVRTDEPEARFAPDATVHAGERAWTVRTVRWQNGRLLLRLDGVADRGAAEQLRGVLLEADVDPAVTPEEPDTYYDRQLVGLAAMTPDGVRLGAVVEVVHLPGHDLLDVDPGDDRPHVLVPFVAAIVPAVDLDAGRVVLTPPPGLFDDVAVPADPTAPGRRGGDVAGPPAGPG